MPALEPVQNGRSSKRRSEDIGNSGKPSSAAAQPAATIQPAAADQKPITFRELDVRISCQYCIVQIHSGGNIYIYMKGNSSEDIGNSGKSCSAAAQPAAAIQPAAADQKPITFRKLDVRFSCQYCIVQIHSGGNIFFNI